MASLLAIGISAAINSVAFSGTNYLFSKISDHGEAERKRYDLAVEELEKDRNEWNKQRIERLDFINNRLNGKKRSKRVHSKPRFCYVRIL